MSKALTLGIHHVGLNVRNLNETVAFFVDHLGFEKVGERPAYPAVFVSDGTSVLTLWQAEDPSSVVAFDRKKNIGLHHIALTVTPENLDRLGEEIPKIAGCELEFGPEASGAGPARHMMIYIPGSGIRVELRSGS